MRAEGRRWREQEEREGRQRETRSGASGLKGQTADGAGGRHGRTAGGRPPPPHTAAADGGHWPGQAQLICHLAAAAGRSRRRRAVASLACRRGLATLYEPFRVGRGTPAEACRRKTTQDDAGPATACSVRSSQSPPAAAGEPSTSSHRAPRPPRGPRGETVRRDTTAPLVQRRVDRSGDRSGDAPGQNVTAHPPAHANCTVRPPRVGSLSPRPRRPSACRSPVNARHPLALQSYLFRLFRHAH